MSYLVLARKWRPATSPSWWARSARRGQFFRALFESIELDQERRGVI